MPFKPANPIPFVKASACGNDFLLIEGKYAPEDTAGFARLICDRNNGVGADGVEWLYEPESKKSADLKIRLTNADGSPAEISGNGTRCVAAWLTAERGIKSPRIATDAGVKLCELTRQDGAHFEFKTSMGAPVVGREIVLDIADEAMHGMEVSMGNPHFVVFVDQFENGWQERAHDAAHHKHFPLGTNVELVRVMDKHEIEVRIFERGVGETLSSGTGSSASAVAAIATGRVQSPVQVVTPGGTQTVRWETEVFLYGPARLLCRGEFFQ